MPHPGELPLGIAARVVLGALGRFGQRDLAAKMPDQPRHAMRLHCRQERIEPARRQCANLLERTRAQHHVEARIDAPAQLVAFGREKHLHGL